MVEYLELSIDELLLDEDNPRLGSVNSQSAALEAIIHLKESHFRNLMLSIKNNGLDPGDNLYVIISAEEDDFIVLEGNRRLSALMVLNSPDVLDGTGVPETIKKSLVRAAAGFDRTKIEPIRCVRFERREDANDWIYRRHTGGADGEGRISWGPLEIQRFSGDRSILDVLDFVGRNADYSDEEWESTKTAIESKKSSNLARLLESAAGRKHLGISISNDGDGKTPMLGSDPTWAIKVLRRIIDDVRDGIVDSRDLNKSSDIEEYFIKLPKELQPQTGKSEAPRPFNDIDIKKRPTAAKAAKTSTKQKTKSAPKPRTTLAPRRHPFHAPTSTKGEALLREAGDLDANRFTISAAFVLRSFIELAINDYMGANKIKKFEKNSNGENVELDLTQKSDIVLKHIVAADGSKNADLRGFRNNILTKTSATSIQSLNGFVHNKFQLPTADALRAGWDCSVPIFIAAYGSI
ncbi:hypothetical protein AA23498_3424 [Acetobacter nitrogenifigens DSM 23921 = NBRC 105050]|uniref:ParB/Sulfiredoxin domain-containing protein n=1 Tax=Acetobacter nitrogenifigens DSM 23921 = NBRC 105050 TaxID=1120919 RepID=A0A511XEZ0_9PROT|nr:hypothetical protein [Acetobacter nitrogenifigens]GBQ99159.1 hypothetical protein AA23498_3424 [Acetobacter nitrogenifigens DSM 23921 = NBRC 105050]GEN61519.1 hypothetical protein ANI02nite_34030 [Acetobacter nitrogenifigens DSM 23921 = NBRC 105050]